MKYRDRLPTGQIPWRSLIAVLALLLGADLLVHHHQYFGLEDSFGFYAWLALLAAAGGGAVAVLLRRWLRRPEDPYDD
ncbi:MAG: hypothetical protein R3310_09200 [Candidatus Competibacteraceae bacterium]|nr:hypothetical protein [Candidatus Competibacteraceae bacterium]